MLTVQLAEIRIAGNADRNGVLYSGTISQRIDGIGTDSAGRMWIRASGPASPVLRWYGRRVGSLGPGLTS